MESSDGISDDAVEGTQEELNALEKELEEYEEAFKNFQIKGYSMTGDSSKGFHYDP
jgi:hypothetical protein